MPELPDVETFKRYLDRTALGQRVQGVTVHDTGIVRGVSARALGKEAEGRRLAESLRHGKHLFVSLEGGPWLVFHFGMTGYLIYFRDEKPQQKYNRVVFALENGFRLAFNCRRKLGFVGLTPSPRQFVQENELGPDALAPGEKQFLELLNSAKGAVKSFVMNQQVIAGVGNVYSDEILFQARIHPQTAVRSLDEAAAKRLYRNLRKVLEKAIERKADPEKLPRSYLTRRRGQDAKCPRCGAEIATIKASGRTAYFCPKEQPPP